MTRLLSDSAEALEQEIDSWLRRVSRLTEGNAVKVISDTLTEPQQDKPRREDSLDVLKAALETQQQAQRSQQSLDEHAMEAILHAADGGKNLNRKLRIVNLRCVVCFNDDVQTTVRPACDHVICSDCHPKLRRCPVCRAALV